MKKATRIVLFCVSALVLISWDRASKEIAKEHLKDKAPLTYLHDTFRLQYVENTGAALSLGDSLPDGLSFWLLSIIPLLFLVGMGGYAIWRSSEMSNARLAAFALIVSGGLGNVYDRIFFNRHVTDFMNVGIGELRTGIFNFADMCITAGVILMLFTFRQDKKKATA